MIMDESCARCWIKRWPDGSPWDGRRRGEETARVLERHAAARQECMRCPLLTQCETYLSDQEDAGLRVDGVIAARYSDVDPMSRSEQDFWQTTCRGCNKDMLPRSPTGSKRLRGLYRKHAGEGLCDECFPVLSRQATRPAPYRRPPQPRHPYTTDC